MIKILKALTVEHVNTSESFEQSLIVARRLPVCVFATPLSRFDLPNKQNDRPAPSDWWNVIPSANPRDALKCSWCRQSLELAVGESCIVIILPPFLCLLAFAAEGRVYISVPARQLQPDATRVQLNHTSKAWWMFFFKAYVLCEPNRHKKKNDALDVLLPYAVPLVGNFSEPLKTVCLFLSLCLSRSDPTEFRASKEEIEGGR